MTQKRLAVASMAINQSRKRFLADRKRKPGQTISTLAETLSMVQSILNENSSESNMISDQFWIFNLLIPLLEAEKGIGSCLKTADFDQYFLV